MSKTKKSGPAIFIYCVIVITVITAIICFWLYYGDFYKSGVVLWVGITAFTIMYHSWGRIIMGNISKLFQKQINYKQWWFKEKNFEKQLYKFLHVKQWKNKALTYNSELFSLKKHSLEEIANAMVKAELDHWINEIISLTTLLFAIPWGQFWIFLITAIAAMIFDAQFIAIQRYNRPRVMKILEKEDEHKMMEMGGK